MRKYPEPVLVTVKAPLKMLFPEDASLDEPFLVELTVPLKVQPLKNSVGLTVVVFPPNAEEGPKVRFPAPVRVRLCAVGPDWVNCRSNKVPAVKPPAPTEIVYPDDKVAVALVLPLQNCTPC